MWRWWDRSGGSSVIWRGIPELKDVVTRAGRHDYDLILITFVNVNVSISCSRSGFPLFE